VPLSESDTRAKLIDPALHERGWTEDLIRREETAGAVSIVAGVPRRSARGRVDYLLRLKVTPDAQPVAVALIEAKSDDLPPGRGLEQAKAYALGSKRFNVPFVFASNGHQFVEYDHFTGLTTEPRPIGQFPRPDDIRARFEHGAGFKLDAPEAKPLLQRYPGGEATRRYYQDAAIRAVLEKVARGENRALLALATGSGKTFIAVQLLKKIADAGQLRRALFVCDRDELRSQAQGAFHNVFGNNAATVSSGNAQENARILVATYQTLDVDRDDSDATFLTAHYPPDHFSHIVIDECHRSAWGKWSEVLRRNPNAVQIGLTATPRTLKSPEQTPEAEADRKLTADNLAYFGEPVYEYDIAQGIEDGYLAACEIVKHDVFLDAKPRPEAETGVVREDLAGKRLEDARTGQGILIQETREKYEAPSFEQKLVMPERVAAMCQDLFQHLVQSGGPEQKSIVFCASDAHAGDVANALNNLYANRCRESGRKRAEPYAFKCTAASGGGEYLADLRAASRHHFVATTVELLTTGVDVPCVRNIVFFKYVRSPIAFHQMVGRGTRLDPPSGKLMFRVYDYTDATRLFSDDFVTGPPGTSGGGGGGGPVEPTIVVYGMDVRVGDAGHLIVTSVDGKPRPVTVEEYKERLAERLVAEARTLEAFRELWITPPERREMLGRLPDGGRSPLVVRQLEEMDAYDLYDVLADIGYGLSPLTRERRTEAFSYKHSGWLAGLPPATAATLRALARQFTTAGTEGLESREVFEMPDVVRAGGLKALKRLGQPDEILRQTKARLFAA